MKIKDYDKYRKSFPYYKVQYFDDYVMAWHDIQRRFTHPDDAFSYMNGMEGVYRIMEVTRDGRHPYEG
jgi:hypothetical protein